MTQSLSKIVNVLGKVAGSGYPVSFKDAKGKYYEVGKIVHTITDIATGNMRTEIELVEVKEPPLAAP
jgi:hypothetical protein